MAQLPDRNTPLRVLYFCSLLLVVLALGPSLAHLLELPNKIGLPAQEYLTVQQIYRGWALLGGLLFGALASSMALAVKARPARRAFKLARFATVCIAAALGVFFALTYPVNQATENWSFLPSGWEALRARWEYSHAVGALLMLTAFVSLLASLIAFDEQPFQVPRGMRRS